jgi:hypothetical protein
MPRKKELTPEEKEEALLDIDDREKELKQCISDFDDDRKKLNCDAVHSLSLRITFQVLKAAQEDLKAELIQCKRQNQIAQRNTMST